MITVQQVKDAKELIAKYWQQEYPNNCDNKIVTQILQFLLVHQ